MAASGGLENFTLTIKSCGREREGVGFFVPERVIPLYIMQEKKILLFRKQAGAVINCRKRNSRVGFFFQKNLHF